MRKIKKRKSKTRIFLLAQAVFVLLVLGVLYFTNAPGAVFISGKSIAEPDISFEVGPGEQIIVSSDREFRNPIVLEEGSSVDLPPGKYFWKSKNWLRESEVKTFEITSEVGLDLRVGEKSTIKNSGNTEISVTEKKGGITSGISLDVGEVVEADEDAYYEGKEK